MQEAWEGGEGCAARGGECVYDWCFQASASGLGEAAAAFVEEGGEEGATAKRRAILGMKSHFYM